MGHAKQARMHLLGPCAFYWVEGKGVAGGAKCGETGVTDHQRHSPRNALCGYIHCHAKLRVNFPLVAKTSRAWLSINWTNPDLALS